MTNRPPPPLAKWPFILTDLVILAGFAWMIRYVLPPKTGLDYAAMFTIIVLWMIAAWIAILPWLKEFQAHAKCAESEGLTTAVAQIERLEEIGAQVKSATASWQTAQDSAARVTAAAKEIEEKIKADSKDFMEFAERINGDEKQHLRLEVEKLRRNEAEWLQVAARMLDHTFALTQAAQRSGQPNLATQMTNFQSACREAARRVGLVPFHPNPGEPFDGQSQQLEDPNAKPEQGATIADILATGFTFQGQLLRKSLVRISNGQEPSQPAESQQEQVQEREPQEQTEIAEHGEDSRGELGSEARAETQEEAWNRHAAAEEARRREGERLSADDKQPSQNIAEEGPSPRPSPSVEAGGDSGAARSEDAVVSVAGLVETHHDESRLERTTISNTHERENNDSISEHPNTTFPSHLEGEDRGERAANNSTDAAIVHGPHEQSFDHHPVEVAAGAPELNSPQTTEEEKPRRRQRKSDPQTSLPF
jgi:molecular chaperone GrpE (heat shock protein)